MKVQSATRLDHCTSASILWKCGYVGCQTPALIAQEACRYCSAIYCRQHVEEPDAHPCSQTELFAEEVKDPTTFWGERNSASSNPIDNIDIPFILHQATLLRPGHTCIGPPTARRNDISGTANIHLLIEFDDGVKWLARLRRREHRSGPREAESICIESSVTTAQVLHEGGVLAPNARMPLTQHDDPSQLDLSFIDFLDGQLRERFLLYEPPTPCDIDRKAIMDLAKWYISLEKLTFPLVGSLHRDQASKEVYVGPLTTKFAQLRDPPYFLGPFKTAKEMYTAHFDLEMQQILSGDRGARSEAVKRYLIALEMKSLVEACKELEEGPWYIKHGDDGGEQQLYTPDGGLTGIVDWDWAYTTCKADAFAGPAMFDPSPPVKELSAFEEILVESYISLGRPDLADFVREGKKYRLLYSLRGGGYPEVEEIHLARQAICPGDPGPGVVPFDWDAWIEEMKRRYMTDEGLKLLLAFT